MLLLVTIGLVLIGAISLVIGFVSSSLAPIYLSIACSIVAGGVLVVFSRMSRRQAPAGEGAPAMPAASEEEVVGAATQTSAPVVPDLPFPIEDYDNLKVNQIVPLLPELDLDELDMVREREVAGRNRATIVKKIDELIAELEAQAEAAVAAPAPAPVSSAGVEEPTAAVPVAGGGDGLPIEDYDSLSVAQILPLLPELDDDELEAVAEYEEQHKNRAQIVKRIDEIFETGEVAGAAAEKLGVTPTATKAPAKKAAAKKSTAKKAPAGKKAAPAKKTAASKKAAPGKKAAAPAKKTAAKKTAPAKKTAAKKAATSKKAAPAKKAATAKKAAKKR